MGYEDASWETKPADNAAVGAGNDAIWDVKAGVRAAFANEHVIALGAAANLLATHKAGSAMCFVGSVAPTQTPAGVALGANDVGRMWLDTTNAAEGPPVVYGELNVWIQYSVGNYGWRKVDADMIKISEVSALPATPVKAAKVAITAYHIPTAAPDALAGAIWIS
jgi:hypothetical protein